MNLLYPALRATSRTDGEWRAEFDGDSWSRTDRCAGGGVKTASFRSGYWSTKDGKRPWGLQL